jgi:hypothetical protein
MFGMLLVLFIVYVFVADRDRMKQGKESMILNECIKPISYANRLGEVSVSLLENTLKGTIFIVKQGGSYMLSDNQRPKEKVINEEPKNYAYTRSNERSNEKHYQQSRQDRYDTRQEQYKQTRDPLEKYDIDGIYNKILENAKSIGVDRIDSTNIEILANSVGIQPEILHLILQRKHGK